ncbi:cytochrome P450 [Rhypophila sp. PSN 637]
MHFWHSRTSNMASNTYLGLDLESIWSLGTLTNTLVAILGYHLCLGIYRIWFHPLSGIPGPWYMAASHLPEFYYDVVLGGKLFHAIDAVHEKYGPVVRISPREVHFDDVDMISILYPLSGRKTNKPIDIGKRTGTPDSLVATVDHDDHRRRRNAMSAFFSNNSIRRLEPIMQERLRMLLIRIRDHGDDKPMVMHPVFRACTNDVITTYAFGSCFNLLEEPTFGEPYFKSCDTLFRLEHVFGSFFWLADLFHRMPLWLVPWLVPEMRLLVEKQQWWIDRVREIRDHPDREARSNSTIFEGVITGRLVDRDLTDKRLVAEAQLLIFAGEGTTAHSLVAAIYHVLANPPIFDTLKKELTAAIPDDKALPTLQQIETLPFLNAVIQETVRLHPGVIARQVRISPDTPIAYKDKYVIPPGTMYSMSPSTTHLTAAEFGPDPYVFRPQRWIENPKISQAFFGFARGSRNCVGMNLARKEMAMILATLFRKYDLAGEGRRTAKGRPTMALYDTERKRDIDPASDYIIPVPEKGSQGLRVVFEH